MKTTVLFTNMALASACRIPEKNLNWEFPTRWVTSA